MLLHHEAGPASGGSQREGRIARDVVNRYFDGEMTRAEREAFLLSLQRDPETAQEVVRIRAALARLDEPVFTPDLSERVLAKVHSRRRFLSLGQRRIVTAGRVAAACAVLMAVGAIALLKRENPGISLRPQPAPVSSVVSNGQADLAGALRQITETVVAVAEPPRASRSTDDLLTISIEHMPSDRPVLNWEVEAYTDSGVMWVSVSAGEWRRLRPEMSSRALPIGGAVPAQTWGSAGRSDGLVVDDGLASRLGASFAPRALERTLPPATPVRVP